MNVIVGLGLFALAAWLGSKHALWIPAVVMAAVGVAAMIGG